MYINVYLRKKKKSGFRQNVRGCMDFEVLIQNVCLIVWFLHTLFIRAQFARNLLNPAPVLLGVVSFFTFVCVCSLTKYLKKNFTNQLHFLASAFRLIQGEYA